MKHHLLAHGTPWVSRLKETAQIRSDRERSGLDENAVREIGLEHGLVDIKVVAIDEHGRG